jgi:hypothetical protein
MHRERASKMSERTASNSSTAAAVKPGTVNGATVPDPVAERRRRIRFLVGRLADRMPLFRGVLRAARRDLGELCELTGTDPGDVLATLDGLDRNVTSLLYWCSGGRYDNHGGERAAAPAPPSRATEIAE